MSHQVLSLFPTPVLTVNVESEIDKKEVHEIAKLSLDKKNLISNGNNGNFFHKNVDILKTYIPNSTLEKVIQKYLDVFVNDVWLEKEARVQITGSWLNVNPPNTVHHEHFHMNSILSGTFYINADPNDGGEFIIHRPKGLSTRQTASYPFGYNNFTEKYVYVPVKTYDLQIFPSLIEHSVAPNKTKSNKTRMSLAFNTFYIGEILMNPKNAVTSLTRLEIKELG